jgi:RecB family exonuclease
VVAASSDDERLTGYAMGRNRGALVRSGAVGPLLAAPPAYGLAHDGVVPGWEDQYVRRPNTPNRAAPAGRTPGNQASRRSSPAQRDEPEQLGFEGMPERLFVCTPSKLAAYEDCPRRYRYTYLDRPAPPKGPPWAHNSLGASVHTALRNWYGLPPERRRPEGLPTLLKATWVREGYRDEGQEREAFRRALGWLDSYVDTLDPGAEPLGVERVVAARTAVLAFNGRADRIDSRPGQDGPQAVIVDYKTGRTGLSADDARGSRALALYAYAAQRVFRRPCRRVELHHLPTGTVAAHEHTDESIERQVTRAEQTARDIVAAERAVSGGADPDQAFPTTPGSLCAWCDYRKSCPAGAQAPARDPWAALEQAPRPAGDGQWGDDDSR